VTDTYAGWWRDRECTRKSGAWATKLGANAAVLAIWRQGRWARPYRCGWCGCWHLTTQDGEVEA